MTIARNVRHNPTRAGRLAPIDRAAGGRNNGAMIFARCRPLLLGVAVLGLCLSAASCHRAAPRQVVIYTSEDEPVASPILRDFEKQSGIHVTIVTDTEATKSIGLAERLVAEKDHPQADVWWSNEAFRTIWLSEQGVLSAYDSPAAKDIPAPFKDAKQYWAGCGIRARVVAVSDQLPADVRPPRGVEDLTQPALAGRIAMARPTAGTTGSFVAALYLLWGDEKADAFFQKLRDNRIALVGGNSVVADSVGQGQIWVGLTDNDDVAAAQANGLKLHAVLPDQDSFGTLPIPGSVALVAGATHPAEAKLLIDYLLSPAVEQKLIAAHSAAWSVRDDPAKRGVKFMDVDFRAVADRMTESVRRATDILDARK